MNMKYGLPSAGAVIDDHPVPLRVQSFVLSNFFCGQEEMADEVSVGFRHAVNIGDMFFWNDECVDGRLRVHVFRHSHCCTQ